MIILSLIIYLLLGLLIYPLLPFEWLRIGFATIYLLFFFLDLGAIYAKGTHFSLAFAANIEKKVIEMMFTSYLPLTIVTFGAYFILIYQVFKYDNYIVAFSLNKLLPYGLIVLLVVYLGLSKNGVLYNVYHTLISLIKRNNAKTIEELSENDFEAKYIRSFDLEAKPGKNLITIYLESFDQNFLDEDLFPGLMPKLKERIKRLTYYDKYVPYNGIDYTMGALYGTQTGLPNYFGLKGNNVFAQISASHCASIGNILAKAGYHQTYLNGGSLEFAGKGNFFLKNHYDTLIGDNDFDEALPRSKWGVYDNDLFIKAKAEYLRLKSLNQPFNLTLLTLDLHFPSGLEDPRLANKYPQKHGILRAAAALDDCLDDFLNFVENDDPEGVGIYLFGDHPIMGLNNITHTLNKKERNLFVLTNELASSSYPITKPIYFYDIPKLMLEGIGVESNAKFLPDLIPDISYKYIDKNIAFFTSLNYLLHTFPQINSDIYLIKDDDYYRLKSGKLTLKTLVPKCGQLNLIGINKNLELVMNLEVENDLLTLDLSMYPNLCFIVVSYEDDEVVLSLINNQKQVISTQHLEEKLAKSLIQKQFN